MLVDLADIKVTHRITTNLLNPGRKTAPKTGSGHVVTPDVHSAKEILSYQSTP